MSQSIINIQSIIYGVEVLHFFLSVFILCHVVILNYDSHSIQLSELTLRINSHATKNTLYKDAQEPIQKLSTFPIIKDLFEWLLVLNILIAITRISFFEQVNR